MKKLNHRGFSLPHLLLFIVILGLIGGTGWYVYNSNKKANKSLDNASADTNLNLKKKAGDEKTEADPYEGWKTYTTKYEKMSFKYPSDLTLTDTSTATTNQDNVTPGMDKIKLTSASGFEISIQTGLYGIGGGCEECTIDFADPVSVAGANYFINYVNPGTGKIRSITVSKTNDDFIGSIDGKTITISGTNNKAATLISGSFRSGDQIVEKPLAQYKADPCVVDFKKLIQSISY